MAAGCRYRLQTIGGAIGLYLAYLRVSAANRQAEAQIHQAESSTCQTELSRRKQASDIFLQAVGQLRDEKLEMRLAAVYTLRKLVDEFPEDNDMVVALLSEHLRENQRRWDDEQALPADISEITKLIVGATQDYDR